MPRDDVSHRLAPAGEPDWLTLGQAANDAASRGAQAFVGKPFSPQELIDQTKQLLPT